MWKDLLFYFLVCFSVNAVGQNAGRKSFEFLQVPNNARLASLGGYNVSLSDRDVNFFYTNPALSSDSLSGEAAVGYQFYIADVGQATFSYAHKFSGIGTVAFGVQHLGYGKIKGYDPTGAEIGDFESGETLLCMSKSHQAGNFRIGATIKMAFSSISGYRANAVLVDFGGLFRHPAQDFSIGLVIKNLGFVVSEYSFTSNTKLPFDLQLGTTFKPEHMPVRFSFTAYGFGNPHAYSDPQSGVPEPGTLDKVLRSLNFGAEVLIHRNAALMIGYNYRIHQELKLEDTGGAAGLSFGFSLRVKTFELTLSRGTYVMGNAGYAFTLSKNIDKLLKRL
ncbi:MAG: type IX secretion system protein PorQ [Chryseolinea sp.]